jgi:hypothetical protein
MTLTFSAANNLVISQDVTLGANGTIAPSGTPTGVFSVGGNWTDDLSTTNLTGAGLELHTELTGEFKTFTTNESFFDLHVHGNITLNTDLTISDTFTIANSATMVQGANTITMDGDIFLNNGTYVHNCSSTLILNGTTVLENDQHYPTVIVNSGADVNAGNPVYVDCDLTLEAGANFFADQLLYVGGDWINNGATIDTGSGKVVMSGFDNEIRGTTPSTFWDLTIGDVTGDRIASIYDLTINNDFVVSAGATSSCKRTRISLSRGIQWSTAPWS